MHGRRILRALITLFLLALLVGSLFVTVMQGNDPAAVAPNVVQADVSTQTAPPTPRYAVIIVLDGARPDYFSISGIPHIRVLMKGGSWYTNAIAGDLESETPTGHAVIGSGMLPRQNGILGFGWATAQKKWVTIFDPTLVQNGYMEKLMSEKKMPSLAGQLHKANSKATVVALGGYKYYANDAMGGPDADVVMWYANRSNGTFGPTYVKGQAPPKSLLNRKDLIAAHRSKLPLGKQDTLAMRLATDTFKTMHQTVTMINVPEFDEPLGHEWGANKDPKDVATLMRGFDKSLGMLEDAYRKAGVLDQTDFIITADHGFLGFNHTVRKKVVSDVVERAGATIVKDTYHTAAFLWLTNGSPVAKAASAVAALNNRYIQSVYYKVQAADGTYSYVRASSAGLFKVPEADAANQYLLGTFLGPSSPDIVVFYTEGAVGLPKRPTVWKGDHGGGDWQSQHVPLLLSGPGITAGQTLKTPAALMDVSPTVLSLLGATSAPMQGVPLADAMANPSATLLQTRQSEINTLAGVVTAMRKEASLEAKAQWGKQ